MTVFVSPLPGTFLVDLVADRAYYLDTAGAGELMAAPLTATGLPDMGDADRVTELERGHVSAALLALTDAAA